MLVSSIRFIFAKTFHSFGGIAIIMPNRTCTKSMMSNITSFQFEVDGELYTVNVQSKAELPISDPDTTIASVSSEAEEEEDEAYGLGDYTKTKIKQMQQQAQQQTEQITQERIRDSQRMIRGYTAYVVTAFKNFKAADIEEITLKFSLKIGSKFSIPYITEGSAESNIQIEVKCKLSPSP